MLENTPHRPQDWPPRPGVFRLRLVRGGPFVPARIRHEPPPDPITGDPLDRAPVWTAEIGGVPAGDPCRDPSANPHIFRIWNYGTPIPDDEYRHMLAVRAWAANHAPEAPEARPERKIDLNKAPPIF